MENDLVDTNVISSFFSEVYSEKTMEFVSMVFDEIPNISVITEIESLSWVSSDKSKELIVKSFIQDVNVLSFSQLVVNQCIAIKRSRKIKTPDAIIAATAIVNKLTLLTNDKDFENIPNLKIKDPSNF